MQFGIFKKENVFQGISNVSFGSMKSKKRNERAIRFLKSLKYKVDTKNLVWAEQICGSKVHICKIQDSAKTIKKMDGLITKNKNQVLAIVSADCVPILIYDPREEVVAALHGSRESLIKGIIKNAISKLVLKFNSNPKEILIGIGPHIRKCHYWLKEQTIQKLKKTKYKQYFINKIVKKNPEQSLYYKVYFDLTKLVFDELLESGLRRKNIEDCGICTFCSFQEYFSFRKREEKPKTYLEKKPVFASFIGLKEPEILKFDGNNFKEIVPQIIKHIKEGKVIVLPTDTVYGLIADATDKKAVDKVFKIKKRSKQKPIPIFVRDLKMAKNLAFIGKKQEEFLKKVWPGKVTAVLKLKIKNEKLKIYGIDQKTIALRIPRYKLISELLKKINRPLTGTSANISGKPASTKIKEVLKQFKNQKYQPDLVIDAGNLPKSKPSKVIDLTISPQKILRP